MSFVRIALVLILSASFGGCAYLHSFDSNLPQQVDEWIQQKEYHRALETLEHVRSSHKHYAILMKQKQRILKLAQELERKTIQDANQLVAQNEWYKANQLYNRAQEKLPDSKRLNGSYKEFIEKRDAYLRQFENRLLVNKGIWINNNISSYEKVKSALPEDYHSINGITDFERDREKTLEALIECAQTAGAEDKLVLAGKCLSLARRMDGDLQDDPRLAEVHRKLEQARESQLQDYKKQTRDLLAEFKQGNSLDILQRAHDHLESADQFQPLDNTASVLLVQLKKRLHSGIQQRMESARRLYSQGKIELALQIWESLQTISPDNQKLEAHIERAQRVLSKLQRLQRQGSSINPPNANN